TFSVLGRVRPGVSLEQAREVLNVRAALLARDYPDVHKNISLRVIPETHARPNPTLGGFLRIAATVLAGLAGVLVLITSANVANLLMARAASRGRLARQFLTESVTLALLACVVAIPVVMFAMTALRNFLSNATSAVAF